MEDITEFEKIYQEEDDPEDDTLGADIFFSKFGITVEEITDEETETISINK